MRIDKEAWKKLSPEEMQKRWRATWRGGINLLSKGGRTGPRHGKVLRSASGGVTVTEGPVSESSEVMGGYYNIEAANYDEAVKLSLDSPHIGLGTIELREIMVYNVGYLLQASGSPVLLEHLFRREAGRIVAWLAGLLGPGHLQLAEDAAQEAMLSALQTWPFRGVPQNPEGRLFRTAHNHIHHFDNYDASLEDEAMHRDIDRLNAEMAAAGVTIFVGGLEPISKAKSLRAQSGRQVVVTDAPYFQAKEHVGGFWVLKTADLNEALAWGRNAAIACRASVEVRAFN